MRLSYDDNLKDMVSVTHAAFFEIAVKESVWLAALEYAFDADIQWIGEILRIACSLASSLLDSNTPPDPLDYVLFLYTANISECNQFRRRLELLQRESFTNPEVGVDELVYLAAEFVRDLSSGNESNAKAALQLADARGKSKSVPPDVREFFLPLVRIAKAILARDCRGLDGAVEEHILAHVKQHSKSDSRHAPESLIDFDALAMVKIAQRYGLETTVESVYLPKELLHMKAKK